MVQILVRSLRGRNHDEQNSGKMFLHRKHAAISTKFSACTVGAGEVEWAQEQLE
jgi:hypothetical protein